MPLTRNFACIAGQGHGQGSGSGSGLASSGLPLFDKLLGVMWHKCHQVTVGGAGSRVQGAGGRPAWCEVPRFKVRSHRIYNAYAFAGERLHESVFD